MVLSLAFILAFIGAAVALLIGILLFSEVEGALSQTFGLSSISLPSNDQIVVGNEFQVTTNGLSNGIGFNDNNDFPSGAVADSGKYYLAHNEGQDNLLFTKISGGNGTTSTTVLIDSVVTPATDKVQDVHIFADNGQIDIVATVQNGGFANTEINHYRSTDDGVTWSSGVTATIASSADPFWATVKGDTVAIFWKECCTPRTMRTISSTDGGATFGLISVIDPLDNTFSTISTDRSVIEIDSTGKFHHLFYAGVNSTSLDQEIFYSRSTDFGISFSSPIIISDNLDTSNAFSLSPLIAVQGSIVTYVYTADPVGLSDSTDFVMKQLRSTDNGVTFVEQTIYDNSICENDETTNGSQTWAIDGSTIVYVCAGISDIDGFFGVTTDAGANWSSLATFHSDVSQDNLDKVRDEFGVDVDGNTISIVYQYADEGVGSEVDTGGDTGQAYVSSKDLGATWSGEVRKVFGGTPNFWGDINTRVSGDNVWVGFDASGDVWYMFSGSESLSVSNTPQAFSQASNIAFTVISILPVALFFALFAIFGGRTE